MIILTTPSGRVIRPPKGRCWRTSKERFAKMVEDNRIWFGKDGSNSPAIKRFLSDVKQGFTPQTIWGYTEVSHNQDARNEILALDIDDFSTPKPEKLLKRIIQLATNENDIVLDFFMGSSTTQAVAMKMNRRFIGIEQMDYINSISIPRLQKVIGGEQGGVSKEVNWQGGGSFIYVELYSLNEEFIDRIQASRDSNELSLLLQEMKDKAYLNFKVDLEKVTSVNSGFLELSLEEQKDVLIQVLDMNQLYLNYSEIEDSQYDISDSVKAFNHAFYQKEGDTDE